MVNNRRGFGLIEVLIAAGLLALISVGIATIMENAAKEQKRNNLLVTLRDMRIKFQNIVSDNYAWINTVNYAANGAQIKCLIAPASGAYTPCTGVSSLTPYQLNHLMNPTPLAATPTVFYSGANWTNPTTTPANGGFTINGASCSTFNAVAGNDNCPIAYRMAWEPMCGSSPTCRLPAARITVRLMYRPANLVRMFGSFVNSLPISGPLSTNTINPAPGRYDFQLTRTASSVSKSFTLKEVAVGNMGAVGAPCPTSSSSYRPRALVEDNDPFNLVTVTGAYLINLEPGTYNCISTAVGFGSRTFNSYFIKNGSLSQVISQGSALGNNLNSTNWQQSTVVLNFNITHTVTSDYYQLGQNCSNLPGGTPNANIFTMGLPIPPYNSGQIFSSLTCTLIE